MQVGSALNPRIEERGRRLRGRRQRMPSRTIGQGRRQRVRILQLKGVTVANGVISGEVYTKPDTDMFGAKVEIDLKFKAAMPN
jgi:hypothetical protein